MKKPAPKKEQPHDLRNKYRGRRTMGVCLGRRGPNRLRHQTTEGSIAVGRGAAAAGTALIYRGATGHCHPYAAAGINTAADEDDTKRALAGPRGVNVEDSVTINASPEELYVFWRNFELLPRFMAHLVEVRQIDVRRSHWVAESTGRTNRRVGRRDHQRSSWRSDWLADAAWLRRGQRRLRPLQGGARQSRLRGPGPASVRSTRRKGRRHHRLDARPRPARAIHEDLRRFKQLMETGEVPTTKGQPRGRK